MQRLYDIIRSLPGKVEQDKTLEEMVEIAAVLDYKTPGVISKLSDKLRSIPGKLTMLGMSALTAGMLYLVKPNKSEAQAAESVAYSDPLLNANGQIQDLQGFLDRCPKNNPRYPVIKQALVIKHIDSSGYLLPDIDIDSIPCYEPISSMSLSDYSDTLSIVKAYEIMDAMDAGMMLHLPWTPGTFFDWFVSGIRGVVINEAATNSGCCLSWDNKNFFISLPKIDDYAKMMDKDLFGILNIIADGFAHERRHADGNGFPHVSCNGGPSINDSTYDVNNLSAFGVAYWMWKSFLDRINLGINGLESSKAQDFLNNLRLAANGLQDRFCDIKPPTLSLTPESGGPAGGSLTGKLVDTFGDPIQNMLVETYNTSGNFVAATVESNPSGILQVVRLFGPYNLDVSSGDKCFNPVTFDIGNLIFNSDKHLGSLVLNPNLLAAPTIALNGNCKTGKPCNFSFTDSHDNSVIYEIDVGNGAGKIILPHDQKSATATYSSAGTKTVTADYACAAHRVVSAQSQLEITVANPDGPDLTAQWTTVPYQTCTKPKKGLQKCTLKGGVLQVSNIGNQNSTTATVEFYLSKDNKFDTGDLYLKQSSVATLKPTKTKNISFTQSLTAGATAKDQYIIAVINLPTDVDTTNNTIVYGPIQ